MDKQFGGFIITYQRPEDLLNTINQVFAQSFPPQKLWIIDNSADQVTKTAIQNLNDPRLVYYAVGYNSGPAGAAKIGLEMLTKEGFQWIYWGDDNDPPPYPYTFERLFSLIQSNLHLKVGQVGVVGQRFDKNLGKTLRLKNIELEQSPVVAVDTISGNQSKIINSAVIREGILTSPELFFGFEELDFDLKMGSSGYLSLVDSRIFLELREKYQRAQFERPVYSKKSSNSISREYYSIRNLLWILRKNRMMVAYWINVGKSISKMLIGFRFGWNYGVLNMNIVFKGLKDGVLKGLE
ncbi:glycosyltransferase [Algoriphagus lacus]|uniref:Glycosyltransferase n=1 Tax=Algoriphagus lacus TaxID=2056311 RepID=A0A418PMQ7_9BACT|nr:glycosyltransferase [Algoriphagus lacus]RIW13089.1 glycosyltransferase [Algoriphagus lacus]